MFRSFSILVAMALRAALLAAVLVSVISAAAVLDIPTVKLDDVVLAKSIPLVDWQLLGPFPVERKDLKEKHTPSLDIDCLGFLGGESRLDETRLATFDPLPAREQYGPMFNKSNVHVEADMVDFAALYHKLEYAVMYAACEIDSDAEREVSMLAGSDDGMRVWVNQKLIFTTGDIARGLLQHHHWIHLHLNKGKNLLIVKVDQKLGGWGLACKLYDFEAGRSNARAKRLDRIVREPFVEVDHSLSVDLSFFSDELGAELQIVDRSGKVSRSINTNADKLEIPLAGLDSGLYTVRIMSKGTVIEESFYYGDPDAVYADLERRRRLLATVLSKSDTMNVAAPFYRLKHLLKPQYRYTENWGRKIVHMYTELNQILTSFENGAHSIASKPGLHFRAFVSEIDGSIQYYMIFIPRVQADHKHSKLPLVLYIPPFVGTPRPFLENAIVADLDEVERVERLAQEHGFAILWPSFRGNTESSSIGNADLFEALANAESNFDIDDTRLFLYGGCTGAERAVILAERYPARFAGMAIRGPSLARTFSANKEDFSSWYRANDPYEFAENLSNIPIYIRHDEEDVIPIEGSRAFVRECQKAGFSPTFEPLTGSTHDFRSEDTDNKAFEFFSRIKRDDIYRSIRFSTTQLKYAEAYWLKILELSGSFQKASITGTIQDDNTIAINTVNIKRFAVTLNGPHGAPSATNVVLNGGERFTQKWENGSLTITVGDKPTDGAKSRKSFLIEGPITHAFGSRFILTTASGGTDEARKFEQMAARRFQKTWLNFFYAPCITKDVNLVTRSDIETSNVIMMGNPADSRLFKFVSDRLPFRTSGKEVTIGRKTFRGDNLWYAIASPNPLNPAKYLVFVGSNSYRDVPQIDWNMAINGKYDFVIWNCEDPMNPKLIDSGFLDSKWN